MASVVPDRVATGDWFVVDTATQAAPWIELGENLVDRRRYVPGQPQWSHAAIVTSFKGAMPMIVEAEPQGAVEVEFHYEGHPTLWSTGTRFSGGYLAATAAKRYIGTGYSFLDYLAIAMHGYHIPAPGLQGFIAATHHMICSQLVDQACQDANIHLFNDSRWPGFVTPLDLGLLLAGSATDAHAAT